jgi:hypothetical protein
VHRYRAEAVYVLTNSEKLKDQLEALGARQFRPEKDTYPVGSYRRAPGGPPEWDLSIQNVEVEGDKTVWEAAAP